MGNVEKKGSVAARAFDLFMAGMARSSVDDLAQLLAPCARVYLNDNEVTVKDLLRFMTKWSAAAPGGKRRLGFLEWVEVNDVENIGVSSSHVRGRIEFDHDGSVDLPGYGCVEPTHLSVNVPFLAMVMVDNQARITSLEFDLDPEVVMMALLAS